MEDVHCHQVETQLQLINIIYIISYHIISYHIISYHIISYHIISYIISYHIISYHIIYHHISYHIISYHIYPFTAELVGSHCDDRSNACILWISTLSCLCMDALLHRKAASPRHVQLVFTPQFGLLHCIMELQNALTPWWMLGFSMFKLPCSGTWLNWHPVVSGS